jgi:hypothetical protein
MSNLSPKMHYAVNAYMDVCKKDYLMWTARCAKIRADGPKAQGQDALSDIEKRMVDEYNDGITFKVGKKYIKVMTERSVHGFIVNTDNDADFKLGDILKAASYNAPARNFARGNALRGIFNNMQWTGA